jgi:hypothetical protein
VKTIWLLLALALEGLPTPANVRVALSTAVITSVRLVNTSAATAPAGFITPMFGQPFRKGDMPAGTFPQFALADGTPVQATYGGNVTWSDGSTKFIGQVPLRVPVAIPGNSSLLVNITRGTSAPASAGLTATKATTA